MPESNEIKPVKAGEFKTGCLYRTNKPFSSRDFEMDSHPRWLLYLGKSSSFDCRIVVYSYSPTTQLWHFENGGDKEKSPHIKYNKGQYGFTEDCVICFDDIIDYLTEQELETYEPLYINSFDENELRKIYECILKSDKIKFIDKLDIHTNLSNINIKNLQKPKRRKR